ncbi:MAG: NUDIX hydrolase [Candidatus Cryosericum sp.]|nr:NUDIX hydrolase [bacterium]
MKKTGERIIGQGKWLVLREETFLSDSGEETSWESVARASNTYVVVVVARLVPSERYVLLRQYRQAIENTVIGFCAGTAPVGSDPETEALRELHEETGFIGRIVGSSGPLKVNVGLSNDDSQYIFSAEIDENDPRNQHPRQELEPSEEIEVVLLREEDIPAFLLREQAAGRMIGPGVWYMFGVRPRLMGHA